MINASTQNKTHRSALHLGPFASHGGDCRCIVLIVMCIAGSTVADLVNAVTVSYYLHPERAAVAAALWILAAYPNAVFIGEVSQRTAQI
jgi:hypothetical protein